MLPNRFQQTGRSRRQVTVVMPGREGQAKAKKQRDKQAQRIQQLERSLKTMQVARVPRPVADTRKQQPQALYARALLDPISGPIVGVPTVVPVQTYITRVKASGVVTVTNGKLAIFCQPTYMLSSTGPGKYDDTSAQVTTTTIGAIHGVAGASMGGVGTNSEVGRVDFQSNAPYTAAQFMTNAGLTASSVRGRVVSCIFRICNTSAANDRNGTFTMFVDPAHVSQGGKSATNVIGNPRAVRYNASLPEWHSTLYHPVEPEEVDGWVLSPAFGPVGGSRLGTFQANATVNMSTFDNTVYDNLPGYMGIWWEGDTSKSQSFLVEAHAIVEYTGTLATTMVRDNPAANETAHHAHKVVESMPIFKAPHGPPSSGHPFLSGFKSEAGKLAHEFFDKARPVIASKGVEYLLDAIKVGGAMA